MIFKRSAQAAQPSYDLYEYDNNGNLIKESFYFYNYRFEYEGGEKFYLNDYITYEYDAAGNETKSTYYNGDGTIKSRTETTYEERDGYYNTKTDTTYNADGTYSSGTEYEYSASGRISRFTSYGRNKERLSYTVYEDSAFPKDAAVGDVYETKSTTYNNAGQVLSYTVNTYKACEIVR